MTEPRFQTGDIVLYSEDEAGTVIGYDALDDTTRCYALRPRDGRGQILIRREDQLNPAEHPKLQHAKALLSALYAFFRDETRYYHGIGPRDIECLKEAVRIINRDRKLRGG